MARMIVAQFALALFFPLAAAAQTGTAAQSLEPFKVGTFRIGGVTTVGAVLRDALVVDLVQANAALQKTRSFAARPMPSDMIELIEQYENGLKGRIYAIVNELVRSKALEGQRPGYVHDLTSVRTLAPIPRPRQIMMTAVNFYSHISENAAPDVRAKAVAARKANRGTPYLWLKATSSVIGTGEPIVMPWGRTQLDWEVELGTIIGRRARYIAAPQAQDHVFGYTVMLDISDRGGR
jgi:2-keto-4-pentenoate hydratase/2-oxohepta-3-ene-1,7-dioic acid hydratase in catechol pathway